MVKANNTVIRETRYIATWIIIFSLVMQAVFLLVGQWNYTVLLGNIWGSAVMILNFFFMGLSVQKAVEADENEAKKIMKLSHSIRTLLLFVLIVIGVLMPFCSTLATIIPLIFPRIAVALRPLWKDKQQAKEVPKQHESE